VTDPRPSRGGIGPSPTRELSLDPSHKFHKISDSVPPSDFKTHDPTTCEVCSFLFDYHSVSPLEEEVLRKYRPDLLVPWRRRNARQPQQD